jgi:hypothetical protein
MTHAYRPSRLVLTYDSEAAIDGLGAQAIRILGIYSIASAFCLHYRHTPIKGVPREELQKDYLNDEEYKSFLDFYNSILQLPSSCGDEKHLRIIHRKTIWMRELLKIAASSLISRYPTELRISLPQGILDSFPSLYKHSTKQVQENLRSVLPKCSQYNRSVSIHIRAEHHGPNKTRRHLAPSYYRKVMEDPRILEVLEAGGGLIVHTDFYSSDFSNLSDSFRVQIFHEFFEELKLLGGAVQIKHYAPIREVIHDLVWSDILVMSSSALSYLAGLLSTGAVIYPPSHGHSKLSQWSMGPKDFPNALFSDEGFFSFKL